MKTLFVVVATLAIAPLANANSFTNGGFETNGGSGQINSGTSASGWYVPGGGYTFLFAPGTADTSGANGQYGNLALWGPGNGSANGLTATSPSGGYFLAQDGDFQNAPLNQDVTGLTIGKTYTVGFDYGFGQQQFFNGATNQSWHVSLGGSPVQSTATFPVASHGFTGWMHTSFNFVATSANETLSFMAIGDQPVPPFALLDGVTFTPDGVPEPVSWALMLIGVGTVGGMARRRRMSIAA